MKTFHFPYSKSNKTQLKFSKIFVFKILIKGIIISHVNYNVYTQGNLQIGENFDLIAYDNHQFEIVLKFKSIILLLNDSFTLFLINYCFIKR